MDSCQDTESDPLCYDMLNNWERFFYLLQKVFAGYEHVKDDVTVDEKVLHHIFAQMEHFLSGLRSTSLFIASMIHSQVKSLC